MVDISSKYGGIKVKNPLICASGPPTHTPEACLRAAQAGFAGVVLKTHSTEGPASLLHTVAQPVYRLTDINSKEKWRPVPPKRDLPKVKGRKGEKRPDYTVCLISPGIILSYFLGEDYVSYANRAKELLEPFECKVIGSIHAFTEESWDEHCELIRKTNVDAVELNLACAHSVAPLDKESLTRDLPARTLPGAVPSIAAKYTEFCVQNWTFR